MKARFISTILFSVSLLLGSCSGEKENPGGSPVDEPYQMDIMQFNIRYNADTDTGDTHWSIRKNSIKSMFDDRLPDVAGLNEARTTQRNDLKKLLPAYTMLEVPNTGTSAGGNVTMVYRTDKFNLLGSQSFYLSATPNKPSFTWDSTQKQYHVCLWGHFQDKKTLREFYVFATHYNLGTTTEDIQARINSTNLILSRIESITAENPDAPVYVVGDMNASLAVGDSRAAGIRGYLDAGFKNARESALSTDSVISYNGFSSEPRTEKSNIDFIFYKNVTALSFKTITEKYNGVTFISDHYPVTVQAITF